MDRYLKYSILRYSPSAIAGEKINLGVIFYNEDNHFSEFRHIQKFNRLSSFDDEIDITLVKKLLNSIKDDVEGNLFARKKFNIDEYIKYYINDFNFDTPKVMKYDNYDEATEELFRAYFRYEYDKKERPNKDDDRKLLEKIIASKGLKYKKNQSLIGPCNEKIKYDIVTDKYNIKIFDFDDKNLKRLVSSVKIWAWNSMFYESDKTIIVYRFSEKDSIFSEDLKIIKDIMELSHAKYYNVEEAISLLQEAV